MYGFKSAQWRGQHFDLAKLAIRKLRKVDFRKKGKTERHFEFSVVSFLESSPKIRENLITQIGDQEVEKVTPSELFGFKHRPDTAIGIDGTAIEIKVIRGGPSVRELLGQAIAYRMNYRFVIMVLIDQTEGHKIVQACSSKNSPESDLLRGLCDDFNIFTVVGPANDGSNVVFACR